MKKIILTVALIAFFVVVGINVVSPGVSAAMPDKSCSILANAKDMIVQKNTTYEYTLSNYVIFDPCTGECYTDRSDLSFCSYNPTPIFRSYDANWPTHYERWYIPESGTIWGKITQYGWYGGERWEYTICGDGTAKVRHSSFGYYYGNYNTVCDSMD